MRVCSKSCSGHATVGVKVKSDNTGVYVFPLNRVQIRKSPCITSLDTACILEGYCLGTFGTLYR